MRTPKYKDISGERFGRLVAMHRVDHPSGRKRWKCKCDCGATKVVSFGSLNKGHTRSCGCYLREYRREQWTRHGAGAPGRRTPEYKAWGSMKERCLNPNCKMYPDYGGRGIRVAEQWLNDFQQFLADMGARPSAAYSLDRIDVNGDYAPANCRWADIRTQSRNRRNSRLITFDGETMCVSDWADRLDVRPHALFNRLTQGWTVERTLTQPFKANTLKAEPYAPKPRKKPKRGGKNP